MTHYTENSLQIAKQKITFHDRKLEGTCYGYLVKQVVHLGLFIYCIYFFASDLKLSHPIAKT